MKAQKFTNRTPDFGVDAVVIWDYSAKRDGSFLAYLDALSQRRKDGGLLHGGHILYIQSRATDLILKAAICAVLDLVPDLLPLELPELVDCLAGYAATPAQIAAINEINRGLLYPVAGPDIIEIIKLAREYAQPREGERVN